MGMDKYIYFGLIPLIISGLCVYITAYSRRENPVTYQIVIWLLFIGYYIKTFSIIIAIILGILVLIIRKLWLMAIKKEKLEI